MRNAILYYNGRVVDSIGLMVPELTGNFRCAVEPGLDELYEVRWHVSGDGAQWEQSDPDGINRLTITTSEPFNASVYATAVCSHGFELKSNLIGISYDDCGVGEA